MHIVAFYQFHFKLLSMKFLKNCFLKKIKKVEKGFWELFFLWDHCILVPKFLPFILCKNTAKYYCILKKILLYNPTKLKMFFIIYRGGFVDLGFINMLQVTHRAKSRIPTARQGLSYQDQHFSIFQFQKLHSYTTKTLQVSFRRLQLVQELTPESCRPLFPSETSRLSLQAMITPMTFVGI